MNVNNMFMEPTLFESFVLGPFFVPLCALVSGLIGGALYLAIEAFVDYLRRRKQRGGG